MIEDCRQINATHGSLALLVPRSPDGATFVSNVRRGEVLAFPQRSSVHPLDEETTDRSASILVDQEWRRRTAGLKKLGQAKSRSSLRVTWPANDRGRGPIAEVNSTLPLHILTGAVVAFGVGLVMAGVGSLVTHPELMPTVTAWFG